MLSIRGTKLTQGRRWKCSSCTTNTALVPDRTFRGQVRNAACPSRRLGRRKRFCVDLDKTQLPSCVSSVLQACGTPSSLLRFSTRLNSELFDEALPEIGDMLTNRGHTRDLASSSFFFSFFACVSFAIAVEQKGVTVSSSLWWHTTRHPARQHESCPVRGFAEPTLLAPQ